MSGKGGIYPPHFLGMRRKALKALIAQEIMRHSSPG